MKAKNPSIVGNGQKAQSGGIQIQPPQGPLSLYTSYTLTVTVDNWTGPIYWSAGPEDPPPGEGKPGHTFVFDSAFTQVTHGTGTINITAVGPNTGTKVTVYARMLDDTLIGSAVLQFVAVETSPSTLGLVSLDATPWLADTAVHLVRATCVDEHGMPLTGEVTWQASNGTILAAQTKILEDGTTTNGVHYPQPVLEDTLELTVTAPDGNTKGELSQTITIFSPLPSIIITAEYPPHRLFATYPAYPNGGAGHPMGSIPGGPGSVREPDDTDHTWGVH